MQQIQWRNRNLPDLRQAGGVESRAGFGADAGQPAIGQGMQKGDFLAEGDMGKRGRFVQLGSDLADELVGGNPLANAYLE